MAISQFRALLASCHVKVEFPVQALTQADLGTCKTVHLPVCHCQGSRTPWKTVFTEATYDPPSCLIQLRLAPDCCPFLKPALPNFLEMHTLLLFRLPFYSFSSGISLKVPLLFCPSLKFRCLSGSFVWPLGFNGSSWQVLVPSDSSRRPQGRGMIKWDQGQ